MSVVHHPDISTLMGFSAGTLDEPFACVVSTHMALCEACRETLHRIDRIGGAVLEAEDKVSLAPGALDRLMGALEDHSAELALAPRPSASADVPLPLARYLPGGISSVRWRFTGPGVATASLPAKSKVSRLLLLRVGAGRRVPEHGHGGQELTLILSGAYSDRFGRFGVGDLADHDEDVEHQPIAEPGEDCICLVAVNAPLTFRSRLMRTLQPLFGL